MEITTPNRKFYKTPRQRFMENFEKREEDDCWIWKGAKNSHGYGIFCYNEKSYKAHRVSWMIYNGNILESVYVLHKCDNPSCINPKHLFLGTHYENMKDMVNKGRSCDNRGERNPNSKLTCEIVDRIRKKYKNGGKQVNLAREFNISCKHINDIVHNRIWRE